MLEFEQVVIELLQGVFVCESTAPEYFRKLNSEHFQEEVSAYLDKIGRRLTKTPNGQAYYVTWKRVGKNERDEVKRVFAGIKQTIRPLIHFITLCMAAEKSDITPVPGDRIEYAMLLKAVTENPHLLEMLREFSTMGKEFSVTTDASPNAMLIKVVQNIARLGYLAVLNRDQESYRFTGKLDYYYQVCEFLMENEHISEPASQEQDDVAKQVRLI